MGEIAPRLDYELQINSLYAGSVEKARALGHSLCVQSMGGYLMLIAQLEGTPPFKIKDK